MMTSRVTLVQKVHACLEILIKCHPAPLKILTGEIEPPCSLEVADMIQGLMADSGIRVRTSWVTSPQDQMIRCADMFERVIKRAGGWEHIVRSAMEYAAHFPSTWEIFSDHLIWIEGANGSRVDQAQMDILTQKHQVSSTTIWRRRKDVPLAIARIAVRRPSESRLKAVCKR